MASLGALAMAACTGSSDSTTPSTTLVLAITTTTVVPDTPTPGEAGGSDSRTTSTTSIPIVVVFRAVSDVFPEIDRIDPALSFRELSGGDLDRLEARFRQDERVGVFLFDVDARGVYQGEEFVAVAVSVAVTPSAVSTPGFSESFVSGATRGGVVSSLPLVVLDQELTSWTTSEADHLLWSYDNLYLIVSGSDPLVVRHVAAAIVTMVIDPPEPPEADLCPAAELVEGEPVEDDADDGGAVDPEACVAPDADSSTTTTEP